MKMMVWLCVALINIEIIARADGVYFDPFDALSKIEDKIEEIGVYELKNLALKGDVPAQAALGLAYHFGKWLNQDYSESFKWFYKAAESGDVMASFYVAGMLDQGRGCSIDHEKAFEFWLKCADAGVISAQLLVSERYKDGLINGSLNLDKALRYAEMAASLKSIRGIMLLSDILISSGNLKSGMEWLEKATWYNSKARNRMGAAYFDGVIVERNPQKAYFWLKILENLDGLVFAEAKAKIESEISEDDKKLMELQVDAWIAKQKNMPKETMRN